MPIQYEGIFAEHFATREKVTIFDTCHMGEFTMDGPNALKDLEKVLSCPVSSMKIGQCRYGFFCNENGGVIDDQITYRFGENEFFIVVNASTQDNDFDWVESHISSDTLLKNISKETGKIDIQGPLSVKLMNKLLKNPITGLKYYHWMHNIYNDVPVIVSRTGYTGEIGFEIYIDSNWTKNFWDDCLNCGAQPAGLGARDTLRLEMGFPLYGHELDMYRNAAESGFSKSIAVSKSFIGSTAVLNSEKQKDVLCGILLDGRRAARSHDKILNKSASEIGIVTSGSYSPSCETAIALGYVNKQFGTIGEKVLIDNGKSQLPGTIVELPFYKKSTARKNISEFI